MPTVALGEATRTFAKIGALSFGGPAGQIALMHRILVDEKRWISEERFLHALNFCMLLPGPEAQQLATYMGWLLHRVRGGLIAGSLFVLPGFLTILALSYLYVTVGDVAAVQGLFIGMKAAVIAIVLHALVRIATRSLKSTASALLSVAAFSAMFIWQVPFPIVIAIAAIIGAVTARGSATGDSEPRHDGDALQFEPGRLIRLGVIFVSLWFVPVVLLVASLGDGNVFPEIALFFSKMAVVTFGGAYAVLAYVSQEAVTAYHWLEPGEMLDGLAMAETTPGPLIMVTQFVGFMAAYRDAGPLPELLAAFLGAALTTWVTFVPCFLWIFVGAPFIERMRRSVILSGALAGITAAVVGVIANLATWFAIHALFESVRTLAVAGGVMPMPVFSSTRWLSVAIVVVAALMLFRFRAPALAVLGVAGALGIASVLVPMPSFT